MLSPTLIYYRLDSSTQVAGSNPAQGTSAIAALNNFAAWLRLITLTMPKFSRTFRKLEQSACGVNAYREMITVAPIIISETVSASSFVAEAKMRHLTVQNTVVESSILSLLTQPANIL